MLIPDAQGEVNVCVTSTENGYARAKCAITIPQRCEINVPVHISRHNNGYVVLLEPHRDLEALQLCAARYCVQVNSSQAFIRLINPNFEQVQIPMNFIVANVVEINQGEIVSLERGGGGQYYQCSTPRHFKKSNKPQLAFSFREF